MSAVHFADLALARRLEGADAAKYADYAHARPNVVPELNPAALPVAGGLAVYASDNSPYSQAVGLGLAGPVAAAEFDRTVRRNLFRPPTCASGANVTE